MNYDAEYVYRNLRPLYQPAPGSTMCIFPPTQRLYMLKEFEADACDRLARIAGLSDPHLAGILYIDRQRGGVTIMREYVKGETVAEMIERGRLFSEQETVKIVSGICEGLKLLHNAGLVHRDVTANNIVIRPGGDAVIIDYGIARDYTGDRKKDTNVLGTVGYAAPEQFGFAQSDPRTDIYAVGVLINVMTTGHLPIEAKADGFLKDIVERCTAIDPKERFASVSDVSAALIRRSAGRRSPGRLLKQYPGFRSGSFLHAALSVVWHLVMLAALAGMVYMFRSFFPFCLLILIPWAMIFPIPFFLTFNAFGIWDRLPFTRMSPRRTQFWICFAVAVLSASAGTVMTLQGYLMTPH